MQLPCEFSPFIEKKVVFCLVVGERYPPSPLSGPTTKKTLFYVCLPLRIRRVWGGGDLQNEEKAKKGRKGRNWGKNGNGKQKTKNRFL